MTAVCAPPMPSARAPTPIFRNCAAVVPTFDVLRNSCAWAVPATSRNASCRQQRRLCSRCSVSYNLRLS